MSCPYLFIISMLLKQRRLIWQIYPSYLLIIIAAVAAVVVYISNAFSQFYLHETQQRLEAHARLFRALLTVPLSADTQPTVDALCKTFGSHLASRLSVILPSGQVIGDSQENPASMDNHSDRPEIQAALKQSNGTSTRYSYTVKQRLMYVAIAVKDGEQTSGVVRASMPIPTITQALHVMYGHLITGGVMVALFGAIISFGVAYWLNRPLQEIRKGVDHFASGHLQHRIYVPETTEFQVVAEALNQMAGQLHARIDEITQQRNELETMLASMVEAVIVVDPDERIVTCNQAACQLFKIDINTAMQRSIQEVIRNVDVQHFLKMTLHSQTPVEETITLNSGNEQFLRAHGTLLKRDEEQIQGVLLVFHNITRLKQLENMRREFVANVSHELKTPITAIKGFVETLQSGALHDVENAPRFLEIIARNASRLETIVNDLLLLSSIEQSEETRQISLVRGNITPILRAALTTYDPKALDKQMICTLHAPETLSADINADLLEQAVGNLLDNAIKYSESGSTVEVHAQSEGTSVVIRVIDHGCGIPAEHLPRLFERFYRVDKARSRTLGGTGLGLSIVKHIVQAHQGTVTVESTVGKGSVFTIRLPA